MEEVKFKDAALAELARLRSRWIMTEAASIVEAAGKPRSYAVISAWRAWRLLDALSQGTVYFQYQKKNGETRMARGTLAKGQDDLFDSYLTLHDGQLKEYQERHCTFVYWDMDKKGFRTFRSYELLHDMYVADYSLGKDFDDYEQ